MVTLQFFKTKVCSFEDFSPTSSRSFRKFLNFYLQFSLENHFSCLNNSNLTIIALNLLNPIGVTAQTLSCEAEPDCNPTAEFSTPFIYSFISK